MHKATTTVLIASLALAAVAVGTLAWLGGQRGDWRRAWGDEATFRAMTASLASDRDLLFGPADESRLEALDEWAAQTVILQATPKGVSYSKPPLYALFAAPFVAVLGLPGMWWANATALGIAAWLAFSALARRYGAAIALWAVVGFLATSVVPAMVAWEMSDLFQFSLALAGLALCFPALVVAPGEELSRADLGRLTLAGALFGLLAASRFPNALVLGGPLAALVLTRRLRPVLTLAGGAVVGFAIAATLGWSLQGTVNPYKSQRATFNHQTGYPDSVEEMVEHFYQAPARQRMSFVPTFSPRVTAYSALYFLVGRHSGLVWYFPAALVLAYLALRRPSAASLALLAAALAAALFYGLYWPTNYFGGATFLGNRYFLTAYPLLLFAALAKTRPPRPLLGPLALPWAVAVVVAGSAVLSLARTPLEGRPSSQSHTHAGLFRLAPYESTAPAIEGQQDRYWSGDLVRFLDPYPVPLRQAFELRADRAPSEVMIGSVHKLETLVLRVRTDREHATLRVIERGEEQRFSVGRAHDPIVLVPVGPTWRHHPFWFGPQPYHARTLRFALESDGEDASALIQYGSGTHRLEQLFAVELEHFSLSGEPAVGATSTATLSFRNTSPFRWKPDDPLPIALSYRIRSSDGEHTFEGPRTIPPRVLEPSWLAQSQGPQDSDLVTLAVPLAWPGEPGSYRVKFDLVIDGYAWFEDRLGQPLAEQLVELPATASD